MQCVNNTVNDRTHTTHFPCHPCVIAQKLLVDITQTLLPELIPQSLGIYLLLIVLAIGGWFDIMQIIPLTYKTCIY